MNKFYTVQGRHIPDLVEYLNYWIDHKDEKIKIYPTDEMELIVGSDFQRKNGKLLLTSAIMIRRWQEKGKNVSGMGKGGHVILWRQYFKRMPIRQKLMVEGHRTMEVVLYLLDNFPRMKPVPHFDFNSDDQFASNEVLSYFMGWSRGLGLDPQNKPFGYVASHVADNWTHKQTETVGR